MIFPWIWRVLPGPALLRVLMLLVLAAGVVMALFTWVFPWVSVTFDIQDQSVEAMP
ncbi:hypothetical protein [Demequina pelophila]|uniref:hypothetical protein n=1 Tax=Demequina pelophila TaxID=1638984 RepID=UPI000A41BEFC|nr:hypothetical protein [Demequina pelophila]